jgi:hypothetical protein
MASQPHDDMMRPAGARVPIVPICAPGRNFQSGKQLDARKLPLTLVKKLRAERKYKNHFQTIWFMNLRRRTTISCSFPEEVPSVLAGRAWLGTSHPDTKSRYNKFINVNKRLLKVIGLYLCPTEVSKYENKIIRTPSNATNYENLLQIVNQKLTKSVPVVYMTRLN